MDDTNSEFSAPSTLSSVSGFSSDASSFLYGGGYAHAPNTRPIQPYTDLLRTHLTSTSSNQNETDGTSLNRHGSSVAVLQGDAVSESPDAAFGRFRTPATAPRTPFTAMVVTTSPLYSQTSKRSMGFILIAVFIGTIIGGVLQYFRIDTTITQWIMMPGTLFLRAIQCVVVPMVFVNLVVATADLTNKQLGKRVCLRLALALLVSTTVAIILGLATTRIMHSVFISYQKGELKLSTDAIFGIHCGNGKYLETRTDGVVTCSATEITSTSEFILNDINSALVRNEALTGTNTTLSDNVLGIINQVVPANIMAAFVYNTLLSIVVFALPLGVTLARSFHGPANLNPLLEFFREVNETLMHMIHYILRFTPFAVLSLLAGSLATSLDVSVADRPLQLVMLLVATLALSVLVHMLVVMPAVFVLLTRKSPLRFMCHMLPAYVYGLGCSSSMATMPLSLQRIETSCEVPSHVMHFVVSVGTSLHMPGTAIYLAVLVHFMADVAGIAHTQSVSTMLVTFLGVLLCTITAPPIPSGALTVLTTAWNIVFPEYAIPDSLSALVVASDVFLDRFVTLCNVNAQAILCRILADQVDTKAAC